MRRATCACLLVLVAAPTLLADWPRFRGPNGQGHAAPVPAGADPAAVLARKPKWAVEVGPGYSSPVVVGGKLYLAADGDGGAARELACLDAVTGKELWRAKRPGGAGHVHAKNSLSTGTPAADSARVVAVFWTGSQLELAAFDPAGKLVWARDLGGYDSQHGPGLSPTLHGNRVYLNLDMDGRADLICFDAADGKELWRAKRKAFRASYSTPLVRDTPSGAEIVVASTAGLAGHDPATGAERWHWDWPFTGMPLRAVGAPVLVGNSIVASAGDGGGSRSLVRLDFDGPDKGGRPTLAWESRRGTPYVPSLLSVGDHLYWASDDGQLCCADPATGEVVWRERAFPKAVSASLVCSGRQILAVAEDGRLVAFGATSERFDKLAEARVAGTAIATPALDSGRVYVRAGRELTCFE